MMAEKIKEQLHNIYEQVTSQPSSGARNEASTSPGLGTSGSATTASAPGSQNVTATGSDLGPGKETSTGSALGKGNEVSTASDVASPAVATTDPAIGSRSEPTAVSGIEQRHETTTGAPLGSRNEAPTSSDVVSPDKTTTDSNTAHRTNIIAATNFGNHDDARRDSDVGPRNEATPEQHHHHDHHHKDKATHGKSDHHPQSKDAKAATATDKPNGIDYGNVSHLGVASNDQSGPRRQSLAESPYRGNIHTTVSPPSPSKKWSFSMGDFGLKLPKQESNAVTQELNKDGSVSMQGGQGRVARGIGSISSNVKRGSVDATVSERDPTKRWSFTHGDFGLKMPKQESNAVAQELNRDGSVSSQGGQGPTAGAAGGATPPLGRQGARGIGSISSSVRRGSVDVSVSEHDKARKWSLKDADFGLKWPKGPSNLQNES
jgi:hypothetical protein